MNFEDNAKCLLNERFWVEEEKTDCDVTYTDRELNKFCHEVVERERMRLRDICKNR